MEEIIHREKIFDLYQYIEYFHEKVVLEKKDFGFLYTVFQDIDEYFNKNKKFGYFAFLIYFSVYKEFQKVLIISKYFVAFQKFLTAIFQIIQKMILIH